LPKEHNGPDKGGSSVMGSIGFPLEGDALSAPLFGVRTEPDQPQGQAGDLSG